MRRRDHLDLREHRHPICLIKTVKNSSKWGTFWSLTSLLRFRSTLPFSSNRLWGYSFWKYQMSGTREGLGRDSPSIFLCGFLIFSFLPLLIYLLPYISSFILLSLFYMFLYCTCSLSPSWAQIFLSRLESRAQVPAAMSAVILTGYGDTCLAQEIIKKLWFWNASQFHLETSRCYPAVTAFLCFKFFQHSNEEQKSVMVTRWLVTPTIRILSVRCGQCPDFHQKAVLGSIWSRADIDSVGISSRTSHPEYPS